MVAIRRILCISGPNLNVLGKREPAIYGHETLAEIHERLDARARSLHVAIDARQTNHEGVIVDWIGKAADPAEGGCAGILINAGAYTHTSLAIYDALRSVAIPCVEVHVSNPDAREAYRRRSYIARICIGRVAGFGGDSYELALEGLVRWLERRRASS